MMSKESISKQEEIYLEETGQIRNKRKIDRIIFGTIAIMWALFQLSLPSVIILDSITIRAIHLAFAVSLVFLSIPFSKKNVKFFGKKLGYFNEVEHIPLMDYIFAITSVFAVLYIVINWQEISIRAGRPTNIDITVGVFLILILFDSARRIIGLPLVLIAVFFSIYAFMGPHLPSIFAYRGVSLVKYFSQITLSTEGIYGIPLDVSATTVYLYVLLGSMLSIQGAGQFFNDIAISILGKYKGGPAKASVVSSGLTGMVSGSSIANVVTTGTFTIPLMKKVGYPSKTAAAIEVAASTNGQLMPPIMGAAAFIIAEYLALSYIDVIKAAALPAIVSYFALFYITHLEASKLGMKGLNKEDIPKLWNVFKKGFYNLIPLIVLIYELIFLRHSPKLAAFNAIKILIIVLIFKNVILAIQKKEKIWIAIWTSIKLIGKSFINGSRNMLSVALATAAAGVVVGIVNMGIGSMIVQIVEVLSSGNIFVLLFITAIASLILGMGLPTTATYIVMASITVPIIVQLGGNMGLFIPAIAAHLFCFYFGILADDTPPVGLAAYTASAIAKSNPIQTGVKGFIYDLRTAIIPFMFVFNSELLLIGISNAWQVGIVFIAAILGSFAFTNAVQGWFLTKNKWWEIPIFLVASLMFFLPENMGKLIGVKSNLKYIMYIAGLMVYSVPFFAQKIRIRNSCCP